ncbi:MAG: hypothetical protein RI565_03700 [Schleiferiaceae bacterium]|nr:hypothetical protein [Schleiferiaceae bacterium]
MRQFMWLLALVSLGLTSCSKEKLDFDMANDIRLSPGATLPLVNARLTLGDLVQPDDSLLSVDTSNALRIYYRQDSIFSFALESLLEVPDQEIAALQMSPVVPSIRLSQQLQTTSNAELEGILFESGKIIVSLSRSTPATQDIDIQLTLHNGTQNGSVFSTTFSLAGGQTNDVDTASLSGLNIDLSDGGTSNNKIDLEVSYPNAGNLTPADSLNLQLNFENVAIQNVNGYFSNRTVNAPNGSFDLGFNGIDQFADGLFLTEPNFTLTAHNGLGLPFDLSTFFTGINRENDKVKLGAPTFSISAPSSAGSVVVSNFSLQSNNSNIVDFLANIPQRILYSGYGEINPAGNTGPANFISKGSKLWLDLEIDLPLELRAENMTLEQTISDFSLDADNPEFLKSAELFFRTTNSIPLDLNVAITFRDSVSGDSLTGFQMDVMRPADVDANGRATNTRTTDASYAFTGAELEALNQSNQIDIKAVVNTANAGAQEVKLYAENFLEMRIAASTEVNVNPTDL